MRLFNKVAIIGTGLIGGSLALAIKKKGLAKEVVGVSRHAKNISLAKKMGAIDRGSQQVNIIKGADLVVLATPVDAVIGLSGKILSYISPECIVTDVASTKGEVVSHLDKIFVNYIGSHPLAGSEKRSIAYARSDIFKQALCVLTPTSRTSADALTKMQKLWRSVGSKVVLLSPKTHDSILSFVSHLPHAVAFSLINSAPSACFGFASGGLKDTTRIAASDPRIWAEIFLSNRANMLRAIGAFEDNLKELKLALRNKDAKKLQSILTRAKIKRETL